MFVWYNLIKVKIVILCKLYINYKYATYYFELHALLINLYSGLSLEAKVVALCRHHSITLRTPPDPHQLLLVGYLFKIIILKQCKFTQILHVYVSPVLYTFNIFSAG